MVVCSCILNKICILIMLKVHFLSARREYPSFNWTYLFSIIFWGLATLKKLGGPFGKFVEFSHKSLKYRYNPFMF